MDQTKELRECDACEKMVENGVYSDIDDSFYCDDCAEYLDNKAMDRLYESEG